MDEIKLKKFVVSKIKYTCTRTVCLRAKDVGEAYHKANSGEGGIIETKDETFLCQGTDFVKEEDFGELDMEALIYEDKVVIVYENDKKGAKNGKKTKDK